jgi:hypothetical protein
MFSFLDRHAPRTAMLRASSTVNHLLQRKACLQMADVAESSRTASLGSINAVLHSAGEPLDAGTRRAMEARFDEDFSQVRIHRDSGAAASAKSVGALAYSVGPHIAFSEGRYAPSSRDGVKLLAHELTHVVQSDGAPASPRTITPEWHASEREASSVSDAVATGRPAGGVAASVAPGAVSMQLDPHSVYCALHAAVCLGLSENPPAAALCWANFAMKCGGGQASAAQGGGASAVASAQSGGGDGAAAAPAAGVPTMPATSGAPSEMQPMGAA